jgi:hypothetical protein
MKWEYMVETDLGKGKIGMGTQLNTLGAAGWELVSIFRDGSYIFYFFKRPSA